MVAFGRTLLGALVLLPLAWRRNALRPVLKHWKVLLLYTALEIIGPWLLLGHAETRLNSSTTGLFLAVVPLIAAVILAVIGDDRFGPRRVAGLVIGFVGAAALVGLDVQVDDLGSIGLLILVTIGYAIGPILVSRRLSELPPLGVVTASLIIAATAYAPFTPLVWPTRFPGTALVSIVVLAVVCTAAAFLLMFALIAEAGPSRMTFVTYVNPAVAIILGAVFLSEPLTTGLLIGFPLVILGSVLGTWRSPTPLPPPEPTGSGANPRTEPRLTRSSRRGRTSAATPDVLQLPKTVLDLLLVLRLGELAVSDLHCLGHDRGLGKILDQSHRFSSYTSGC